MDANEAARLAKIISDVDGGCSTCVKYTTLELVRAFPDHDWPALVGIHKNAWGGADETEIRQLVAESKK